MGMVTIIFINSIYFIAVFGFIFICYSSLNRKLSSIRAKQIELDGWIRAKEERLIK